MTQYIVVHSSAQPLDNDTKTTLHTSVDRLTVCDTIKQVQETLMPYFEGLTELYSDWALFEIVEGKARRCTVTLKKVTTAVLEIK